jgi:hypothetical protein
LNHHEIIAQPENGRIVACLQTDEQIRVSILRERSRAQDLRQGSRAQFGRSASRAG